MSTPVKPSTVFVHGIWADGSSFSSVMPTLQADDSSHVPMLSRPHLVADVVRSAAHGVEQSALAIR